MGCKALAVGSKVAQLSKHNTASQMIQIPSRFKVVEKAKCKGGGGGMGGVGEVVGGGVGKWVKVGWGLHWVEGWGSGGQGGRI